MLRIGLREHHQFNIGRIAPGFPDEEVHEVIDLVFRKRESEAGIGFNERLAPAGQQVDRRHRLGREMAEQLRRLLEIREDGLDHPVVQQGGHLGTRATDTIKAQRDSALDAFDGGQSAVPGDIGSLRRPRRNRSDAGRNEEQRTAHLCLHRTLLKQGGQLLPSFAGQWAVQLDEMPVIGADDARPRNHGLDALLQTLQPENGESGSTAQKEDVGHDLPGKEQKTA